jgi:hypothetical protein
MSIEILMLAILAAALMLIPLMKSVANGLVLGLTLVADNQQSIDLWPVGSAGIVMMAPPVVG